MSLIRKTAPAIILFFIFAIALFFRAYLPYDVVISNPIKYSADDGVYHMRLLENDLLGGHFPHHIFFDVFTNFPHGGYNSVAPFYDQFLAFIIWIVSFGNPTVGLINTIAPFYPAVMGALVSILAYFIGKALWGKPAGLFSALFLSLSVPFLFRSLLGSTDHHVAEVFLTTMMMMFFIFSIKAEKNKKRFWLFTVLAGLSMGIYLLTWLGGVLFIFIIFAFIVIRHLLDFFTDKPYSDYNLKGGITIFLIALALILLYFRSSFFYINIYNFKHFIILVLGAASLLFLRQLTIFIKDRKLRKRSLLTISIAVLVLFLILAKIILPSVFDSLWEIFMAAQTGMSPNEDAKSTVLEMIPLGFGGLSNVYSTMFYLFLAGLGLIIYSFFKSRKPDYLLLIVWSLIILFMTGVIPFFGARRYTYYLSVNVSLLVGFLTVKALKFGWKGLRLNEDFSPRPEFKPYLLIAPILVLANIVLLLVYPFPFNAGFSFPKVLPDIVHRPLVLAKEGPYYLRKDWYGFFDWLKENTPDPGVDYYALYSPEDFSYPEEAYGILARWDIGHALVYYSHRIPVSNPFHQGLGRKEGGEIKNLGEGVFFLETDEEKAISYLDELRAKYVVTDYDSADPRGITVARIKWVQGNFEGYWLEGEDPTKEPNKFDNSIIARMHFLDGSEETTQREVDGEMLEFYIKPLDHFRLIYESETNIIEDINLIKLFEYVKGAKITGKAKGEVLLSLKVKTNQDREFYYNKTIEAKGGYFETIVPYQGNYVLTVQGREAEVEVEEEDVLKGNTISL